MSKWVKIGLAMCLMVITVIMAVASIRVYTMIKNREIFLNSYFISEHDIIGADLSRYQGDVDMDQMKEDGIEFVYIKATEGSQYSDEKFQTNWKKAEKSGIPAGAYHFFSFESGGKTQAENYIQTVGELKGRLVPVVDVEFYGDMHLNPPAEKDVENELKIFLEALEEEYHVKPVIYTEPGMYRRYLKDSFVEYRKWMSSIYIPLNWQYSGDWDIWQYTDRGELRGVSTYIDLNVLNSGKKLKSLIVR